MPIQKWGLAPSLRGACPRFRVATAPAGPADPGRFPAAAGATPDEIQARFHDGISYLREVARILAVPYGTPDLGNKPDPTDELVYIILARHTREGAYQQAYDLLKKRFPRWDDLLDAPPRVDVRSEFRTSLFALRTSSRCTRSAARSSRPTLHVGRVGPYRELGLSLEGRDHKQLQRDLVDLIPPNLRYGLYVNLVQTGRIFCRAASTACPNE
jgi:DNA (cytosine-5)-methyltransferase 1